MIRIVIADDHKLFRQGLAELFSENPKLSIAGMASNGREALELARRLRPDVLVLDISMPDLDGLQVACAIRKEKLPVKVVLLTMHKDAVNVRLALEAGVDGYVLKDDAFEKLEETIAAVAPRYRYMARCVVIGRGYNYATAFETALKLKEMTYTIVEPYSSADFLHGPLAMLEPGFPVIVIAPSGRLAAEAESFIGTLRERQAEVIAISDDAAVLAAARVPLALPASVPEWLSPLTAIIPGQLLALQLAHARDFDVDAPRAIRKVTETV